MALPALSFESTCGMVKRFSVADLPYDIRHSRVLYHTKDGEVVVSCACGCDARVRLIGRKQIPAATPRCFALKHKPPKWVGDDVFTGYQETLD